jgi:hypothetical protein
MKTLRAITTAALLACAALGAQAALPNFAGGQFDTQAVAVAGALADVDLKSSPPEELPLVSSAVSISGANFASGAGFAAYGLLAAQTEASSVGEATSSAATASYTGLFSMSEAGKFELWIDLFAPNFTDAGQYSDASLFVTLTFEGSKYADLLLGSADSPFYLGIDLPGAGSGTLALLLSSEANAMNGDAANFAQAEFRVAAVPEPGAFALMLAGGAFGWLHLSRRRAKGIAPV